jgi:hypothetical protein
LHPSFSPPEDSQRQREIPGYGWPAAYVQGAGACHRACRDPSGLTKPLHGIRDGAEDETGKDCVKGIIRECQLLHIHLQMIHLSTKKQSFPLGTLQHGEAEINGSDLRIPRIVGKVFSGSYTYFQGLMPNDTIPEPVPPGGEPKPFDRLLQEIIENGQSVISSSRQS